jgi:galactoside 2-L-fucosyltransferase 1/2
MHVSQTYQHLLLLPVGLVVFVTCMTYNELKINDHPPVAGNWVASLPVNQFGNQLFVLASTHGIARARSARWCVLFREELDKYLTWIDQPEQCPDEFWIVPFLKYTQLVLGTGSFSRVTESFKEYARYTSRFHESPSQRILIYGCLQSYKYFDKSLPVPFQLRATENASLWVAERNITGALHVRRGDKLLDMGNVIPASEYYTQALTTIESVWPGKNVYVVLTDDPGWVHAQAVFEGMLVLNSADMSFDMAVISQCRHKILSVGTFGWWGAYLGDSGNNQTGGVLYPIPQMKGRKADGFSHGDYFPAHWTSVDYGARNGWGYSS